MVNAFTDGMSNCDHRAKEKFYIHGKREKEETVFIWWGISLIISWPKASNGTQTLKKLWFGITTCTQPPHFSARHMWFECQRLAFHHVEQKRTRNWMNSCCNFQFNNIFCPFSEIVMNRTLCRN